jgi:hypothetical protein
MDTDVKVFKSVDALVVSVQILVNTWPKWFFLVFFVSLEIARLSDTIELAAVLSKSLDEAVVA